MLKLMFLLYFNRNPDDRNSCQTLQILFAFSVPTLKAIDTIRSLHRKIVSAGAVRYNIA